MASNAPASIDYIALTRERLAERRPRALELGDCMAAAVLVLLYPSPAGDCVLLTRRTDLVEHHKGQISFAGGRADPEDADLETTALREAFEEVGVDPAAVEVLGRLDDLVTISNFRVTPVVGVLHQVPYEFVPSPIEVAEVLEVPIAHLLDAANFRSEPRELDGVPAGAGAYVWRSHRIWGATARMLGEYLDLLREALDDAAVEGEARR